MAEYNNRLDKLTIIPTLRCDLECDHCCRCSGPDRTESMDHSVLAALRSELPDWVSDVCISGGEPFLDFDLLSKVVDIIPWTGNLYIATNGVWAQDEQKRYRFFSDVLPKLKWPLDEFCDIGLTIELSTDQFHRSQTDSTDGWSCLMYESENGCQGDDCIFPPEPEEGDFDDYDFYETALCEWEDECHYILDDTYVFPDMEYVTIGQRFKTLSRVMPIGRGVLYAIYDATDREYCQFDGDDKIENSLTVWPDGRASACCNGGAWVGNITTQALAEILKQRRSFLFWLRRKIGSYPDDRHGVPISTCEHCLKYGREYFGHSFRKEDNR